MPDPSSPKEKKKETPSWKLALLMPYLISQIVLWGYVFYMLLPEQGKPWTELESWTFDQYWRPGLNFPFWLTIAQSLQLLDVIYSLVGVTNNNLFTVF